MIRAHSLDQRDHAHPGKRIGVYTVRVVIAALVGSTVTLTTWLAHADQGDPQVPQKIAPPQKPVQFSKPQFGPALIESSRFIEVVEARRDFKVSGKGLTVAVLDSGLRTTHVDVKGRVVAQRNFTTEGGANDVTDKNGHGTNVGGIIVANGDHTGIAPEANIVPLKVLRADGGGSFKSIDDALKWVIDHRVEHSITVVNMSLGDSGNYTSDNFGSDSIRDKIKTLRAAKVAVVIAAGNDFKTHESKQGMGYPGIIRESVSVGAVFDADIGPVSYASGAKAFTTGPGRYTPFSQRLHTKVNKDTRTDIFAPGAPVTSSGIANDHGESTQHGTSQAAPVTAGVILLMQEFYKKATGKLPEVDDLETWLRRGSIAAKDGDDEDDNVVNTNEEFQHLNAYRALQAVQRELRLKLLRERSKLPK